MVLILDGRIGMVFLAASSNRIMHGGAEEMHGSSLERYIHMRQGEFEGGLALFILSGGYHAFRICTSTDRFNSRT